MCRGGPPTHRHAAGAAVGDRTVPECSACRCDRRTVRAAACPSARALSGYCRRGVPRAHERRALHDRCSRSSPRAAARSRPRVSWTATTSKALAARDVGWHAGVDSIRVREPSSDSRRVGRARRPQVALRAAATWHRPRGERRRPDFQEGRDRSPQHGRTEHRVVRARAARVFRLSFPAPRPIDFSLGDVLPQPPPIKSHEISELVLHPGARVNRFEEKAAFAPLERLCTTFRRPTSRRPTRSARRTSSI